MTMTSIRREVLGIYLGKDCLQYACARRILYRWSAQSPLSGMEAYGSLPDGSLPALKEFLSAIRPAAYRQICLALPRSMFFIRDIQLPAMPLEDALASVVNSLGIHCHLPIEEIYHDIHFLPDKKKGISAILYYAPRKALDACLDLIRQTGHGQSLRGIFPVGVGIGAWLAVCRYDFPLALATTDDGIEELAVFCRDGMLFSGTWPVSQGKQESGQMQQMVWDRFPGIEQNTYALGASENGSRLPAPRSGWLGQVPPIWQNLGVAALATAVCTHQPISLDGGPIRIRLPRPLRALVPAGVALAVIMAVATWHIDARIHRLKATTQALKAENKQALERLGPIEKRQVALTKAKEMLASIDAFVSARPPLYSALNEIAKRIPQETWFSSLTYGNGTITMSGQSKDALKVLEAVRSLPQFDQVKLRGTVSRTNTKEERFNLSLQLKGTPR